MTTAKPAFYQPLTGENLVGRTSGDMTYSELAFDLTQRRHPRAWRLRA